MKRPEDLLGSANYFHWEFNMRMTLARKGLLEHITVVKTSEEASNEWKVNDQKAYAIIAQGIQVVHQSKIRGTSTAKEAWDTLHQFYNRSNIQNRVALTRRLHEFKMDTSLTMSEHLDKFDELVLAMEAVGDAIDQTRQLVILLGSLPAEYDVITSIIENIPEIKLIEVKEKLLKEFEKLKNQDTKETAFRVRYNNKNGVNSTRKKPSKFIANTKGFRGRCNGCSKYGHMKRDCPELQQQRQSEVMFMAGGSGCNGWLVDSGASSHMSPNKSDFSNYQALENPVEVTIADGATVKAVAVGEIVIEYSNELKVRVTDVYHIPDLDRRLISVAKLTQRGLVVQFGPSHCSIIQGTEVVMKIPKKNNVYVIGEERERAMVIEHGHSPNQWELWHARLGHAGYANYLKTQQVVKGLPSIKRDDPKLCGGCMKGKKTVQSFPKSTPVVKSTQLLQLVHSDVMGPMQIPSSGGAKYVLIFVDDYSRYVTGYFLKKKSEVPDRFREYKALVENQFGTNIKNIRTDNGTEYVNKRFDGTCKASGIVHQLTTPYSPQQNGLAERMNRTVMEMARSMLHFKGVEMKWWAEAVNTAIFITNRTTNSVRSDITPYEICFQVAPNLEDLRVFGSVGYAHIDKSKRSKLHSKSYACMLLGFPEQTKGYRVLDIENGKVKISRSVTLDEREVNSIYDVVKYEDDDEGVQSRRIADFVDRNDDVEAEPCDRNVELVNPGQQDDEQMEAEVMDVDEHGQQTEDNQLTTVGETNPVFHQRSDQPGIPHYRLVSNQRRSFPDPSRDHRDEDNQMVFRPTINRRRWSQNQTRFLLDGSSENETNPTRLMIGPTGEEEEPSGDRSIVLYQSDDNVSDCDDSERPNKRSRDDLNAFSCLSEIALTVNVPTTYKEATECREREHWMSAIENELHAHTKNGTWTIVPRTAAMKVIGNKWLFVHKRNEKGEIVRYKARLVALGFGQKFGVNFFETYSPVANTNSIRMLIAMCSIRGYTILQFDVDTAFLYGVLEELVYMNVPTGIDAGPNMVCKLNKSLYGLKQAAHVWNKTINSALIVMGFTNSMADPCIYVKVIRGERVFICLYVDDLLVAAQNTELIDSVKNDLMKHFRIKELGLAKYVLGMEINQDSRTKTISIKQTQYIDDVTNRFNQAEAKPVSNPCDSSWKLSHEDSPTTSAERTEMRKKPYRQLIGCLLYISICTRPDISYAVNHLSRYVENPGELHWKAGIRVLRYLRTTRHYGLLFGGMGTDNRVEVYCDADWGSNVDDRRSVSGVMILMNGAPVIYKSKYQKSVALSSSEAEYMAMSLCVQEVLWMRSMLKDLCCDQAGPTIILEDNQGAIGLAKNIGYQGRTKHVDIRYHFVREKVQSKEILLQYVQTSMQLADIMTKALGTKRFNYLRNACGVRDLNSTSEKHAK